MDNITFSPKGWAGYCYWQANDKKIAQKINQLLKDIQRNGPADGIGKPEALRYMDGEAWSRRIDGQHRLSYTVENGDIIILSCRGHYDD